MIDLATLAQLDALAESAARDEDVSVPSTIVKDYVRNAAASVPVQSALASGRYWREVPVGVLQVDDSILEGAIDLLYEHEDGTFAIVDYKTDRIGEHEVASRAESYRAQGEAYAQSVVAVTGTYRSQHRVRVRGVVRTRSPFALSRAPRVGTGAETGSPSRATIRGLGAHIRVDSQIAHTLKAVARAQGRTVSRQAGSPSRATIRGLGHTSALTVR